MKCLHCGGRLTGDLSLCPSCGVRTRIDLRQVNHRDLGKTGQMTCPTCPGAELRVVEFDTQPTVRVENCASCCGIFFNPGELEAVLSSETHPTIWMDPIRIDAIAENYGSRGDVLYRKCPTCRNIMNRVNFGGRSGVIVDHCSRHGMWLDSGELLRLLEWWHAGGKHLHQANELEKAKRQTSSDTTGFPSLEDPPSSSSGPFGPAPSGIDFLIRTLVVIAEAILFTSD